MLVVEVVVVELYVEWLSDGRRLIRRCGRTIVSSRQVINRTQSVQGVGSKDRGRKRRGRVIYSDIFKERERRWRVSSKGLMSANYRPANRQEQKAARAD